MHLFIFLFLSLSLSLSLKMESGWFGSSAFIRSACLSDRGAGYADEINWASDRMQILLIMESVGRIRDLHTHFLSLCGVHAHAHTHTRTHTHHTPHTTHHTPHTETEAEADTHFLSHPCSTCRNVYTHTHSCFRSFSHRFVPISVWTHRQDSAAIFF